MIEAGDLVFWLHSAASDGGTSLDAAVVGSGLAGDAEAVAFHVAIVSCGAPLRLIHASPSLGVVEQSMAAAVSLVGHRFALFSVRLGDELKAAAAAFARRQVGLPYNDAFSPDSSAGFYCSQLVAEAFRVANRGAPLFRARPLTFVDSASGRASRFWADYFAERRVAVPEGLPGSHPHDFLSASFLCRLVPSLGDLCILASRSTTASVMADDRCYPNTLAEYSPERLAVLSQSNDRGTTLAKQFEAKVRKSIDTLECKLGEALVARKKPAGMCPSADATVYTGVAGIAMLYHRLATSPLAEGDLLADRPWLIKAESLVDECLANLHGRKASFLCGDGGPLALAAIIYEQRSRVEESRRCLRQLLAMADDAAMCASDAPDEVLFGRVGYLYALLFVRGRLREGAALVPDAALRRVVDAVIDSGRRLAHRDGGGGALDLHFAWHGKVYVGAAHGLAGIYFQLLQVPWLDGDEPLKQMIERGVKRVVGMQLASGNVPSSADSSTDRLVHWCHGAPGCIHLFIKAHQVFGGAGYLEAARRCADVIWSRGLLRKGDGLCHGVSGNAYAFIALWRATGDAKQLYRALKFAEWLLDFDTRSSRVADRPFSLFEGMAGVAYFLTDLLDLPNAQFPAFY